VSEQLLLVSALLVAVVTAGEAGRRLVAAAWRFLRLSVHAFEAIVGNPDRAGLIDRLDGFESRMAGVEHELHPNSGTSMRDAINRIEHAASTASDTASAASQQVADLTELVRDKRSNDMSERLQDREAVYRLAARLDEMKHAMETGGTR
jgi:hypothetical protein